MNRSRQGCSAGGAGRFEKLRVGASRGVEREEQAGVRSYE
jgi:hypothetical protein